MKIEKIVKLKNNKYKIYTSDEPIITFDNVIIKNNLLSKKDIDKYLYKKILNDTLYYDVYDKTLKYILKRKRSKLEVLKYLDKFNLSSIDKSKIISKLEELNFINDKEYCSSFINDKIYLSKMGINKIKLELLRQEIPIEIIEKELSNIDVNIFNDRLQKLILKRINSNKKYSNGLLYRKILNEMINLGYNKDIIIDILDKNVIDDKSIIENEFNKIYDKLYTKYNGTELKNKIIKKLITKGFRIVDINILLQEKTENF